MRSAEIFAASTPYLSSLPSLRTWYLATQLREWQRSELEGRRRNSSTCRSGGSNQQQQLAAETGPSRTQLTPKRKGKSGVEVLTAPTGSDVDASRQMQVGEAGPASETGLRSCRDAAFEQAVASGNGLRALERLRELQNQNPESLPESQNYGQLLQQLTRQSDFSACWQAYEIVKPSSLRYSSLAAVMAAAIRASEALKALDVFRDMQRRRYQPNITTWCCLISGFNKSRKRGWPYPQTAFQLWQELQGQPEGILKDVDASSYATGMMACCGVGRVKEAETLLAEMRAAGFRPDIRAYNILIRGCAQAGEVSSIPELLAELKAQGLQPSTMTYNTLIDAYVNAGQLQEAQAALAEAKQSKVQVDAWAYSSLLKGFVREELLSEASSLVEEMEAAGIHPNVVTFSTLLDGNVRAGNMEQAEQVLKKMRSRRIPANVVTFNTLLKGYAKAGNLEAVRDTLHRMGEAGVHPREDTFNTLMEGALLTNDPQLVPRLFRQLVNLDLQPDSLSYTALITALARMSLPDSALKAFGKLEGDWGLCTISLNALVAALANANRIPEAEQRLAQAAKLAAEQGNPPPIEAYGAVLKAYARRKDVEAAMDVFQEFQSQGGEPDDRLIDMAVTACIRARQFKRALQFVRAMERRGKILDKARLKRVLEVVIKSQKQAFKPYPGHVPKNENLERFKFWLGFPNRYYGTDID